MYSVRVESMSLMKRRKIVSSYVANVSKVEVRDGVEWFDSFVVKPGSEYHGRFFTSVKDAESEVLNRVKTLESKDCFTVKISSKTGRGYTVAKEYELQG